MREQAYRENNYCCWACGINKDVAKYHPWLEGHESYRIDYENFFAELEEVTALCHSCHNFIHSGRLFSLVTQDKISKSKFRDIMRHGFRILEANGLEPNYRTVYRWKLHNREDTGELGVEASNHELKELMSWNDWHMLIAGEKYYSLFEDYLAYVNKYCIMD